MQSVTHKPVPVSSYDMETGETTYNVTQMDAGQRWRCAIAQATEQARRRFPHSAERVEKAYELVSAAKVVLHPKNKTATVTASGDRMGGPEAYTVNGVCECPDAQRAPESWCKHRLAVAILRGAIETMKAFGTATAPVTLAATAFVSHEEEPVVQETTPVVQAEEEHPVVVQEPAPVLEAEVVPSSAPAPPVREAEVMPSVPRIPSEFLYQREGTTAIRWGGLLHLAHEAGLCSLGVDVVTVTPELAVMRATATFNDGGIWTDIGDASPGNVGTRVAPHFIRMASTRAMARCLRIALNVPFVCAVELHQEE